MDRMKEYTRITTKEEEDLFDKNELRTNKLKRNKQKLQSKLLMLMERDVRDKLEATEHYQQVVQGRGAVSVHTLTTRLITFKQVKEFNRYAKEFKETRTDLLRQGNAQEMFDKMFNTLFILELNQDKFKDRLNTIYGQRDWPHVDALATDLH
jgi:hypothetical protein